MWTRGCPGHRLLMWRDIIKAAYIVSEAKWTWNVYIDPHFAAGPRLSHTLWLHAFWNGRGYAFAEKTHFNLHTLIRLTHSRSISRYHAGRFQSFSHIAISFISLHRQQQAVRGVCFRVVRPAGRALSVTTAWRGIFVHTKVILTKLIGTNIGLFIT